MKLAALVLATASLALPAHGEPASVFQVDYSNPDLAPSHWVLTIHPDGTGHFQSRSDRAPTLETPQINPPNVDRDIRLSEEFVEHVFQTAQNRKLFKPNCESHLKVAFQGWKRLTYSGPEGKVVCEFNYARDKEIQSLGDSLVSVATTIIEGAKLETLLQHDRLGLDKETEYLLEATNDGRAQQIYAIQEILQRLADDEGVMERVRKRVRVLMATIEK
jgi:hypothetical protein